ncbi:hypothetical protein HPB52_024859 [Rhipicephalus sanguineus]|uniref:Ubiquitin-like domain-containing protein n=1 Tax=Rhipicephalus sanguineus TaxID=34632 RepID=A0A9D4TDR0_RHISA|nr:hypothetical protein HPB52_024859 [Rhipicephalus sanguineus]
MKLTVTTLSGELYMIDVGAEMELEGLKALCEFESGVPAREMVLMHEGRPLLDEKRSLKSHSIKEGDVLLIQHLVPPTNASTSSGEGQLPVVYASAFFIRPPLYRCRAAPDDARFQSYPCPGRRPKLR